MCCGEAHFSIYIYQNAKCQPFFLLLSQFMHACICVCVANYTSTHSWLLKNRDSYYAPTTRRSQWILRVSESFLAPEMLRAQGKQIDMQSCSRIEWQKNFTMCTRVVMRKNTEWHNIRSASIVKDLRAASSHHDNEQTCALHTTHNGV